MKHFIILLLSCTVLSACVNNKTTPLQETQLLETEYTHPIGDAATYVNVAPDNSPYKRFTKMPLYYQQDFVDVPFGLSNVGERGSLITCLAMIDSYYQSDYITPDVLLGRMNASNSVHPSKDTLIQSFCEYGAYNASQEHFDISVIAEEVVVNYNIALIRIPHTSIYGETSSYIIVTGATEDGDLIIRDPNKNNQVLYCGYTSFGEPIYMTESVVISASSSAELYIFSQKGATYEELSEGK